MVQSNNVTEPLPRPRPSRSTSRNRRCRRLGRRSSPRPGSHPHRRQCPARRLWRRWRSPVVGRGRASLLAIVDNLSLSSIYDKSIPSLYQYLTHQLALRRRHERILVDCLPVGVRAAADTLDEDLVRVVHTDLAVTEGVTLLQAEAVYRESLREQRDAMLLSPLSGATLTLTTPVSPAVTWYFVLLLAGGGGGGGRVGPTCSLNRQKTSLCASWSCVQIQCASPLIHPNCTGSAQNRGRSSGPICKYLGQPRGTHLIPALPCPATVVQMLLSPLALVDGP